MFPYPHIKTYYSETLKEKTRYPWLVGQIKGDICVIGGGFSGVATALMLAERGLKVILLESKRIGWGASGRNGGQCIAGFSGEHVVKRQLGEKGDRLVDDLRYRGHEIIRSWIAKYQIACDWKSGWMEVATERKGFERLRNTYKECLKRGSANHLELVEGDKLQNILNSPHYSGGLIDRKSGHLHPLNLCVGEARAAHSLGASIYERSEAIEIKGGIAPYVRTHCGQVNARTIVLAGDTYHQFIRGRLQGLQFPTGSYMIATEPLNEKLAYSLNPQDLAICDTNTIPDYFRMTNDHRILFGGRCNYLNRDPKDITNVLRKRLLKIFPQIPSTRINHTWAGRIGVVLNRAPAIGQLEPNLYFLQGYCGHGINVSHIAAEIIANAICGNTNTFQLFNNIKHVKVPFGPKVGNAVLALSMVYNRFREFSF